MIQLHYWPTPNGHKITLFLEEAGLTYQIVPVNIGKGEQFQPEFLAISPNNRIPAIVDQAPTDGGAPIGVFESGAILLYLAEKTGRFLSTATRERVATLEWLCWQVGGLGPMLGQNHHFNRYAPEKIPYAIERYVNESKRLYKVLEKRLTGHDFLVGNAYSIADMACYPWTVMHETQQIDFADYPRVQAWFQRIAERPATQRAYALAETIQNKPGLSQDTEAQRVLFGIGKPA